MEGHLDDTHTHYQANLYQISPKEDIFVTPLFQQQWQNIYPATVHIYQNTVATITFNSFLNLGASQSLHGWTSG